jgi:hypothetical protein
MPPPYEAMKQNEKNVPIPSPALFVVPAYNAIMIVSNITDSIQPMSPPTTLKVSAMVRQRMLVPATLTEERLASNFVQ